MVLVLCIFIFVASFVKISWRVSVIEGTRFVVNRYTDNYRENSLSTPDGR